MINSLQSRTYKADDYEKNEKCTANIPESKFNWVGRYEPASHPIVAILWMDASQASREYFKEVTPFYKPGILDEVVGYLAGETEEFYIIADSYEADNCNDENYRQFRSIRNIPKCLVCKLTYLTREESKNSGLGCKL